MNKNTFVIAEAGVNHNGSLSLAKKMIKIAARSGVDAVKFQTFKAKNEITRNAPMAEYQTKGTKNLSQFEMVKKFELSFSDHQVLQKQCKKLGVEFMSSAFDIPSLKLLKKLRLKRYKIPSSEITNYPYLKEIGKYKKPIILSTGMSTIYEIKKAIAVLKTAGTKIKKITLLHCNTAYPTDMSDVNLLSMLDLKKKFKTYVGYSDHTLGIEVSVAAAALGALVIEKHFTINRKMKGPDHSSSLQPQELKKMVLSIRNIGQALGKKNKHPSKSEKKNIFIVRKSIVAKKKIKKGETLTEENITTKRPAFGISPMKWNKIIGTSAKKNFSEDDFII